MKKSISRTRTMIELYLWQAELCYTYYEAILAAGQGPEKGYACQEKVQLQHTSGGA